MIRAQGAGNEQDEEGKERKGMGTRNTKYREIKH